MTREHGLGRLPNKPDPRDWTLDELKRKVDLKRRADKPKPDNKPVPDDEILDQKLGDLIREGSPFLTTWKGILALWRWIKSVMKRPVPPAPVPSVDGPLWDNPIVLDQGVYGTCVGNAWAGWGNARPVYDQYNETDARAIYYEATNIGGYPDDPDAPGGGMVGSTTRDGVKAMQARNKVKAYAFAQNEDEIDEWLNNYGPVVIGIDWYEDMFDPDRDGTVHMSGAYAGGHEVVVLQNLVSESKKLCRNSWGTGWGVNGDFKITNEDFSQLMRSGGDACLAAEVE